MFFQEFRKICQDYCKAFDIPYQNKKVYKRLYDIYKQDINANCHEDVSVDVAQFLDANQNMLDMKTPTYSVGTIASDNIFSFANMCELNALTPTVCKTPCKAYKKEEENSMAYEKTDTAVQRDYFTRRLTDAYYDKEQQLIELFRIRENSKPRNYKELIDYIKNGKYELDEKRTKCIDAAIEEHDGDAYFNVFDGIKFNGRPGPDHEGYNAAEKEMYKRQTAAKDAIMTNPADGAKAVAEFEAWLPEGKSN